MSQTSDKAVTLRIIFAGTPEFAAVALQALLNGPHQIVGVYTQPDRPAGRGRKLTPSPVKVLALEHKIPVYQPSTLKDTLQQATLADLKADVMVVAAYGLMLPEAVLSAPRYGCINIHASLLPRWRGAAPIQHAIFAGDRETGITIMQMDAGLDTGAMLHLCRCPVSTSDTGSSLHDHLAKVGATAITRVLEQLPQYQSMAQPQNNDLTTYATKLNKSDAAINWQRAALQIEHQVRAFNSWPVAYTDLQDIRVRVWMAHALQSVQHAATPGTILASTAQGLDVACGEGVLRLESIQLPGARALSVAQVLNAKQALFQPGAQFNKTHS